MSPGEGNDGGGTKGLPGEAKGEKIQEEGEKTVTGKKDKDLSPP